jgi:glycine dehydrogenase subunit 2
MGRDRTEPLIFDKSAPGHRGTDMPPVGVPEADIASLLPGAALRTTPPRLPELSELQVVRHYTRLSQLNYSVDTGFYPLGSCTMKHNPKLSEEVCALAGFAGLHPYQEADEVQGMLRLMHETERALLEITGMHRASLQPAAGAHGELTGILMIKAYHAGRGDTLRDTVLTPDSAHGTNAASAAMAGYKVVEVPSSSRGLIDLEALRSQLSHRTAALMLTNPNTLGLFEEDVLEIVRMAHDAGALCYYDGANLNAIMGKARPGDMGMDVVHVNLHKTFSTPHGGGGPGAGPVAVNAALEPYLPLPLVWRSESSGEYGLDYDRPLSIGRVKGFLGNIGVVVRAYSYLLRMGGDGLTRASEDAVLSANYLRVRLRGLFPTAFDRTCMHEFVLSTKSRAEAGGTALNIAKRILDFGMHAPTVYFPLIVPEALMVEPTETEDLQTLDSFVEVMRQIDRELREEPEIVRTAPHTTPVRRPDETQAARHPMLRWSPSSCLKGLACAAQGTSRLVPTETIHGMPMTTRLASLRGVPLIETRGEIDHESCGAVDKLLDDAILQGSPILLVDLAKVSYIDSGGLSVLFSAGRRVRDAGWIGLISPNASVRRLLELVGALADPAFRVFQDRAEAEASLTEGATA